MKLGIVTYNIGKDWDLDTLIANCEETGFDGVELRTTHAHGVEVELSAAERTAVRKRFGDSKVEIVGLGSAFEYDAIDPEELKQHIEGTKEYIRLAHDLGVSGIKVRPNKIHVDEGVEIETTLEQIGVSLAECGEFARDLGVQIRLEVHGRTTSDPVNIRKIMDYADHDNVFVCWNSNMTDLVDGSIDGNFASLQEYIRLVHITELWNEYPWSRLFELLRQSGYTGFCLAEIPASADAIRLMCYYRALWRALAGN
ncbi:MAG: sugar phosphate isomerase/epimerase [Gemmatimonadetes bacterium]|jgi:sugar phosphate isomerase/epimerase|nr:sugar phosphate isomerase/epimerase [Gemmatimonadota bacterium]MBT5325472.1 sugar phosphate isomerase/epimerase [Gemmatimonadota bacterium]MBT5450297.1 sugar phosphate isomerase/epimerase [Gemmatimonadota bacterium]MBT5804962.1 sugar phosphate isomerase/epimerase [Gemmatimonadota bacterium]MBT6619136.1 sugar phosphate isomerase/epimerase [Gemmatimonadota bacterium]